MSNVVFNGQQAGPEVPLERLPQTIHPNHAAGAIRVGSRNGKPWEPVMLYRQAHAEIEALWAIVDELAAFLGNSSRLDGPAWMREAEALGRKLGEIKSKLGSVKGGVPSAGLHGCAAGG